MNIETTETELFEPAEAPVRVDLPQPRRVIDVTAVASKVDNRRPVLPAYMTDKSAFKDWCRYQAQYGAHTAKFHAIHTPIYAGRLVRWTPRGLWLVLVWVVAWVFDREAAPARHDAVRRNSTTEYMALSRQRNDRVRKRGIIALAGLLILVAGGTAFYLLAPAEWLAIVLVATVGLLGKFGSPADRRLIDPATVTPFLSQPLRADMVTEAFENLGIEGMSGKTAKRISFPAPIRDIGSGWLATIDLPAGVTPGMVMDRRDKLASALRRPVGCIWPDVDHDAHGGRLELTVLKVAMAQARPVKYPLRSAGVTDIFEPVPFGTDQRVRPVTLPMIESNLLIGSLPGAGKTASLRCVLAGCALDPTVDLRIYELKGSGDLESFARISHEYGSGVDDETIEACLNGLRELYVELGRRAARLKALRQTARDLVPDSKVTRELANKRSSGLHPIVFAVDECQELFSHQDYGKEAGDLATAIIKRGRALAVMLILATQRPDKDSLPTGVSANVGTRFCLRVMSQVENDMVLGTSAYKNGIRATMFTRSDKGIGYLVGATDAPTVAKTHYLDAEATDAIVARAYLAREKAGLLTGHAAGLEVEQKPKHDLLADARAVFASVGGDRLRYEELLERLVGLRPEIYDSWDVRRLGAELRERGVQTVQVYREIDGKNQRGLDRADLEKALTEARPKVEITA
jgi:S-DNA-T family DNA segregation ATPase FtsK/SpoIIIE